MNVDLQNKIIILSLLFLIIISYFVKRKDLQIKHSLVWYFASLFLIIVAVFPRLLHIISYWFGIVDITNSIYLIIIAFLLFIVFLNNITISKQQEDINSLIQEISILKSTTGDEKNDICVIDNSVCDACNGADIMETGIR